MELVQESVVREERGAPGRCFETVSVALQGGCRRLVVDGGAACIDGYPARTRGEIGWEGPVPTEMVLEKRRFEQVLPFLEIVGDAKPWQHADDRIQPDEAASPRNDHGGKRRIHRLPIDAIGCAPGRGLVSVARSSRPQRPVRPGEERA